MNVAHIINHTHWDREWFLTHEYTTAWIPALIDSLDRLAGENPDYEFLFDGQTLVIEDLIASRPELRDVVRRLVGKGNLSIGPLYSQPDWRMNSGELLLRNLIFGVTDAENLGGAPDVAWLVDTFGHVSQAPQMLALAGVDAAFVWRGVPAMTPLFRWQGADGTALPTIDLFGGYRNLYGIAKTADIAVERLVAEVDKLAGSYGGIPIPLFDGYDLDTEPEDPVRIYSGLPVPESIELVASSPRTYVEALRPFVDDAPTIAGELLSGKFGATFPGSLSARTYLKVLHHDAERAVHRVVEPLAVMASAFGVTYDSVRYEAASRELLRNGVHDCICGVSIDQVHERMERSYRRLLDWADGRQRILAGAILGGFATGTYAISTNSQPMSVIVRAPDSVVRATTEGIGVFAVEARHEVRPVGAEVDSVDWDNDHYSATVDSTGLRIDGLGEILRLAVFADDGDTYSSEPGELLGYLTAAGPITRVDESEIDSTVRYAAAFQSGALEVWATVTVRFDDGPVIDLTVEIDSAGTGFRVEAEVETGIHSPTIRAGMPFDIVERDHDDHDLLGAHVDRALAAILMGQRELGRVTEFPFHDHVAMTDDQRTVAVLAPGLRSYRSSSTGTISVTLRRATEWLARSGLQLRSGDAGPAMYVPGARSERTVTHRLGVVPMPGALDAAELIRVSDAFRNPPVVGEVIDGPDDGPSRWEVFSSRVPVSSFFRDPIGDAAVRLFNPGISEVEVSPTLTRRSLRGADLGDVSTVRPKEIVTAIVELPPTPAPPVDPARVAIHTPIRDRAGRSRSRPDAEVLDELDERIDGLERELDATIARLDGAEGDEVRLLTHRRYVVERELLELRLSLELNERLAHATEEVSIPDDPDPVIAELGLELNDLRVRRRIYDYVVQAIRGA